MSIDALGINLQGTDVSVLPTRCKSVVVRVLTCNVRFVPASRLSYP